MAATTTHQRFRRSDSDWTPTTTTKITTRLSPLPKVPRDEQVRIARPLGSGGNGTVARRPTPLDVKLAQAKGSVRLVSKSQQQDGDSDSVETLRDPEIIDLASAPINTRKRTARREVCPPYPPRQPPPPPPKPRRMPPPSMASRQSEMSFGILDYYIHDPSPMQSPSLPGGTMTLTVVDSAIERFDFGLGERRDATRIRTSDDAKSGADDDEMQLIPLSPRPFEEDKSESPPKTNRKKKQYSLFPAAQEVTPSSNRLAQVINESPVGVKDSQKVEETTPYRRQEPNWRPRLLSGAKMTQNNANVNNNGTTTRQRTDTITSSSPTTSMPMTFPSPITTIPSPSYHPRTSSRSFSNNIATTCMPSASISSSTGSGNGRGRCSSGAQRIPFRVLSSSSTATTATANTTSRSSASTSPGSTIAGQQKPLLSRWSEYTALASPTTAAAATRTGSGCRASFGSLLLGDGGLRAGMGSGEVYPDCFFEDDDDDFEIPLGRKGGRRQRAGNAGGWKWLFCCGTKG